MSDLTYLSGFGNEHATEAVAGNPVPVIGYTVTYALANIVLPLLGPIFVAAFTAIYGHPVAP